MFVYEIVLSVLNREVILWSGTTAEALGHEWHTHSVTMNCKTWFDSSDPLEVLAHLEGPAKACWTRHASPAGRDGHDATLSIRVRMEEPRAIQVA